MDVDKDCFVSVVLSENRNTKKLTSPPLRLQTSVEEFYRYE